MRRRPTDGYAERLNEALTRGPRPMSVRGLAKAIDTSQYRGQPGTSYGSVRQYCEGVVRKARVELLRSMGDVLGVRGEWLAFGEGAMTEEAERQRLREMNAPRWEDVLKDAAAAMARARLADGLAPGPPGHALDRAAIEGLRSALPLQDQLVYEWRGLSAVAAKLGTALGRRAGPPGEGHFREGGAMVGEAVAAVLRIIRADFQTAGEERLAQAFVGAMGHAVGLVAHLAGSKEHEEEPEAQEG